MAVKEENVNCSISLLSTLTEKKITGIAARRIKAFKKRKGKERKKVFSHNLISWSAKQVLLLHKFFF